MVKGNPLVVQPWRTLLAMGQNPREAPRCPAVVMSSNRTSWIDRAAKCSSARYTSFTAAVIPWWFTPGHAHATSVKRTPLSSIMHGHLAQSDAHL